MAHPVFPQLSLAELAQIWKTGGQAVADLAAHHGVSQRAIMRGVWYARTVGEGPARALAGDAARKVAQTGLNFAARSALTSTAATVGEATLAGTLGTLATVAAVVVIAVGVARAVYPYTIKGRIDAGQFDGPEDDEDPSPHPTRSDHGTGRADERSRNWDPRIDWEKIRREYREKDRLRKQQHDQEWLDREDPLNFEDELILTGDY